MLVLSGRVREKIVFPGFHTSVQVLGVASGAVRLGIDAPPEVRVLREVVPDRAAEWGPAPDDPGTPSTLLRLNQLVDRRLAVAHRGLAELHRHLRHGQTEDAAVIADKLDEDLRLLRRRLWTEVEQASPSAVFADDDGDACPALPCRSR